MSRPEPKLNRGGAGNVRQRVGKTKHCRQEIDFPRVWFPFAAFASIAIITKRAFRLEEQSLFEAADS